MLKNICYGSIKIVLVCLFFYLIVLSFDMLSDYITTKTTFNKEFDTSTQSFIKE